MLTTMQHKCIKCSVDYSDNEPENYYCSSCLVEKKRIAAEIDAKLDSVPKKAVLSDWQIYQQANKIHGFVDARNFL